MHTRTRLHRWLDRADAIVRRRRGRVLVVAGASLGASLALALAAPPRFAAEAVLAAAANERPAPLEVLRSRVLGTQALGELARDCDLPAAPTLAEVLLGRGELRARLNAELVAAGTGEAAPALLRIRCEAPSVEQARATALTLAERVVAVDASLRGAVATPASTTIAAPGSPASPTSSSGPDPELALARLLRDHPDLLDVDHARRTAELAREVSEARLAAEVAAARAAASRSQASELEQRVNEEALTAWRAHLEEEELARRRASEPPAAPQQATSAPAPGASPSRLAELEAELRAQLVTRTDRHPEVRRLLRAVEAERRLLPSEPTPTREADPPAESRPVGDDSPWLQPIAGDALPPAPGGEPPAVWRQRAPSYPAWTAAVREEAAARHELQVHEQTLTAREGELARLRANEQSLGPLRLERARLETEVRQLERARRANEGAPAPATAGPRPLELIPNSVQVVQVPSMPFGLVGSVLLALLLGLGAGVLAEARDRACYTADELEGLGVPILGVIPRSRGR